VWAPTVVMGTVPGLGSLGAVPDRDLFANFERMRREMDELFGDLDRRAAHRSSRGGFSPAVDVYYEGDPPRAVVRADLAGVDPGGIALEIRGRELILSGTRPPERGDDRVYQQLEIEHGPFRRVVPLGADVDQEAATAAYEDGMLIVELPLAAPKRSHTVRIESGRDA
jgi:HSP20 family protein